MIKTLRVVIQNNSLFKYPLFQIGANAAISSDVRECSDIGLQMLNKGGNAVDAAVAAMFCLGVVNAESSGLGGYDPVLFLKCLYMHSVGLALISVSWHISSSGGFMLVHDHKVEKSEVFDFRETAPSQARPCLIDTGCSGSCSSR